MRTIDRLGTFDQVAAGHSAEVAALVRSLRALIVDLDPDVVEVPRTGEGSVAYGVGERKMSEAYAYLMPQRDRVNLGFFHAASLPDPAGLLEGTGVNLRHVKVRPGSVDEPAIRALLVEARRERVAALARR